MTDLARHAPSAWPTELRFRATARVLRISFDDGFAGDIPYELLRVESPSAEVQGHGGPSRPPPPAGKRHVGVVSADPVGRYAVRIRFDDGHATGLFTWTYLRELAQDPAGRLAGYAARLEADGLSRDARG
ncbi:DUF971 domain-containing protein [bacterium]|nr:DUF971 domain-containing protein [bacterium]